MYVPNDVVTGVGLASPKLDIAFPVPLKVSIAERFQIDGLTEEWATAGVYLLLERPGQDGAWSGYVGMTAAAGGVRERLKSHVRDPNRSSWYRAVLVHPTDNDWDKAEAAWVEAHTYQVLSQLPDVSLANAQEPGDGRLAQNRQLRLMDVPEALMAVLALIGHSVTGTDTHAKLQRESPKRPSPKSPVTEQPSRRRRLADLLRAGLLDAGTKLVPRDARWTDEATVTAEGRIDAAGATHDSPSAAARAISGRKQESGWTFWAVESAQGPTLRQLRDRLSSSSATPPTPEILGPSYRAVSASYVSGKAPQHYEIEAANLAEAVVFVLGKRYNAIGRADTRHELKPESPQIPLQNVYIYNGKELTEHWSVQEIV